MRKEEFGEPLEGWTYNEQGEIFTASGYTTNAQHIEAALWIMGILLKQYAKDAIYSDERPRATRPLLEPKDLGERFGGKKYSAEKHAQDPATKFRRRRAHRSAKRLRGATPHTP